MNERQNTDRIKASAITLITVIAAAVTMMLIHLTFVPPENRTWPPVDDSEILLLSDIAPILPPAVTSNAPSGLQSSAEVAHDEGRDNQSNISPDVTDAGPKAPQPTPPVSSTAPSEMKTPPAPEQTGPSKEELERQRKEREQHATTKRREDAMKAGFGSSKSKVNSVSGGKTAGTVSAGSPNGQIGYNLAGRTIAGWGKANVTAPSGSITITIRVDRQGKVTEASYRSGTGAAAASEAVRADCVRRALSSTFSTSADAPPSQTGTITYTFTTANQ
ncbi:MAG: hypothetical protein K2M94_04240 [Paramuribaculum sp.]|nr:hypothetical protein [Paramuribaculum sp.]